MKLTARKIRKIRSTLKRFAIYIDSTHKFDFMSLKPTRYVFAHDIDEAYWRFYRRNTKNITSWIIPKIDNYDSRIYYENPSFIYECHKEGKVL